MQYQSFQNGYFVRLERGERVTESLHRFFQHQQVTAGLIQALGALESVRLGYFDRERKQYLEKEFSGVYELLSFQGNVALVETEPFLHAHAVLGAADYLTYGGHFIEGIVAVTMEVVVLTFPLEIHRRLDEKTGLRLWDMPTKA